MDLFTFLKDKVDQTSYRFVEEKTGISRGALSHIIKNKVTPEIPTLLKIAESYGLPNWQVLEWVGIDLGLNKDKEELVTKILSLVSSRPMLGIILDHLLNLEDKDMELVVAYLEGIQARPKAH